MHIADFPCIYDNVKSQFKVILERNKQLLKECLQNQSLNCHKLLSALDEMDDSIGKIWYPLKYIVLVSPTNELQQSYQEIAVMLSEYAISMGQNRGLFVAINHFLQNSSSLNLNFEQIAALKKNITAFQLSGIHLNIDKQKKYQDLQNKQFNLMQQFEANIANESTDSIKVKGIEMLQGIPNQVKEYIVASNLVIPLNEPIFQIIMDNAIYRNLRQSYYLSYMNRASNNENITLQLIQIRRSLAHELGYKNYSEFLMQNLTFKDSQKILDYLSQLINACRNKVFEDLEELQKFAYAQDLVETIEPWDLPYYTKLYGTYKFALSEAEIKEYLPLGSVLNNFFLLLENFFKVRFVTANNANTWDNKVISMLVVDNKESCVGVLYFDLFYRPKKLNSSWTETLGTAHLLSDGSYTIPKAIITCNFKPSLNEEQHLLTLTELRTLFHEIGHALHHIFAKGAYILTSGMNSLPLDINEVYSLLFEKFCWQEQVLEKISTHYHTKEPMPINLIKKINSFKEFPHAIKLVQRVVRAIFDLRIHTDTGFNSTQELLNNILLETNLPKEIVDFNPNNFSLIFSQGYASRYYGYLWSEIIASNILEYFLKHGLQNEEVISLFIQHFMKGNIDDMLNTFFNFSNQHIDVNALLKQRNILESEII